MPGTAASGPLQGGTKRRLGLQRHHAGRETELLSHAQAIATWAPDGPAEHGVVGWAWSKGPLGGQRTKMPAKRRSAASSPLAHATGQGRRFSALDPGHPLS